MTIDWPDGFARALECQRTAEKCARALFRLAADFWKERGKFRSEKAEPIEGFDRDLLRNLQMTRVEVEDKQRGVSWRGELFEARYRWRSYRIPLIEMMEGSPTYGRCVVCRQVSSHLKCNRRGCCRAI